MSQTENKMKKAEIIKVDGGYEITLHTEDFTTHQIPIIQRVYENGLQGIFKALEVFYGEGNNGTEKNSPGDSPAK